MKDKDIQALNEMLDWKNCVNRNRNECNGLTDYIFIKYALPLIAEAYGKVLNEAIVYGKDGK